MNVLIDGRPFIRTSAGISTVLRCVLISWANMRKEDVLYVVLPKAMHSSMEEYVFPNNVKWICAPKNIFKYLPNICYLFFMVPYLVKKYNINVYYSPIPVLPYFIPKKVISVIEVNDVVNLEYTETMYLKNRIANILFFSRAIKKADIIWTISNYTKERIDHYYPQRNCDKIFVGCSIDRNLFKNISISSEESKAIKNKYRINDDFILFVGSLEPRKNLPFLLQIIPEIYKKTSIQLVVVGAKGWKNSAIRDTVENEKFPKGSTVFCGYVSNTDLVKLYNMAKCFVSTSLNEGFGLPQLEAFACGCPVVTAANSAMIEIAQGKSGALLIQGYDQHEWVNKIISFIDNSPAVVSNEFNEYDWNIIVNRLITRINNEGKE